MPAMVSDVLGAGKPPPAAAIDRLADPPVRVLGREVDPVVATPAFQPAIGRAGHEPGDQRAPRARRPDPWLPPARPEEPAARAHRGGRRGTGRRDRGSARAPWRPPAPPRGHRSVPPQARGPRRRSRIDARRRAPPPASSTRGGSRRAHRCSRPRPRRTDPARWCAPTGRSAHRPCSSARPGRRGPGWSRCPARPHGIAPSAVGNRVATFATDVASSTTGRAGLLTHLQHGASHDVARRQVAQRVESVHEPLARGVAEHGPLAAERLGQQPRGVARHVERRRVELHELQVGERRARVPREREPLADRRVGAGPPPVDAAGAAGGQHDPVGGDQRARPPRERPRPPRREARRPPRGRRRARCRRDARPPPPGSGAARARSGRRRRGARAARCGRLPTPMHRPRRSACPSR